MEDVQWGMGKQGDKGGHRKEGGMVIPQQVMTDWTQILLGVNVMVLQSENLSWNQQTYAR